MNRTHTDGSLMLLHDHRHTGSCLPVGCRLHAALTPSILPPNWFVRKSTETEKRLETESPAREREENRKIFALRDSHTKGQTQYDRWSVWVYVYLCVLIAAELWLYDPIILSKSSSSSQLSGVKEQSEQRRFERKGKRHRRQSERKGKSNMHSMR